MTMVDSEQHVLLLHVDSHLLVSSAKKHQKKASSIHEAIDHGGARWPRSRRTLAPSTSLPPSF
jgi:hypothetical protein